MTTVEQHPNASSDDSPEHRPLLPILPGLAYRLETDDEGKIVHRALPQHVSSRVRYQAEQRHIRLQEFVNESIVENAIVEALHLSEVPKPPDATLQ
jgi:hypothetical protein